MAGRPRDERGRFISRAAAAERGMAWPTSGSSSSTASSRPSAVSSSYSSAPSYNYSAPSYNYSAYTPPVYTPPAPVQTSRSDFAATRPRDERGRFISREAAEARGMNWPAAASAAASSTPSPMKAQIPSVPYLSPTAIHVQAPAPTFTATRPRDEKGRFISREAAETKGMACPSTGSAAASSASKAVAATPAKSSPNPVQASATHPAASRPRDEKGRFISRAEAEARGLIFPSTTGISKGDKDRLSSSSAPKVPPAKDIYSTPPSTKTRSEAAKARPRDAKGRFVKITHQEEGSLVSSGTGDGTTAGTNRRPRDAKGRFVKRLVLSSTSADHNEASGTHPAGETISEASNKRPRPRDSKGRFVKRSDANSETERPTKTAAKTNATTDRPRDSKGRFVKRSNDEQEAADGHITAPTGKAAAAKGTDRPRDALGRFVKRDDANRTDDNLSHYGNTDKDWTRRPAQSADSFEEDEEPDNYDYDYNSDEQHYQPQRPNTQQPSRTPRVRESSDDRQGSYNIDQLCPFSTQDECQNGENCPYLHIIDSASEVQTERDSSGRSTPISESSENSSESESVIYVEDKGTQTDEEQAILEAGKALCQRMMSNPAIKNIISDRKSLTLNDLCALFYA